MMDITPEEAQAELERREAARAELSKRQSMQSHAPQSFGQQHPILQNLYNIGGGAIQGAINIPGEVFNLLNSMHMLSDRGEKLPITAPHLEMPGVEQNALTTTAGELLSPIGGIGGLAGKTLAKGISKLTGKEANRLSKNLYENLSAKLDTRHLNEINMGNILKNYSSKIEEGANKFENFLNEGEKAGYLKEAHQGFPGISSPTQSKVIRPISELSDNLNKIMETKGIGSNLSKSIANFQNNPSLRNSHDLQSQLFKEKQGWMKPEDRNTRNILNEARDNTLNSIKKTLEENGDKELLHMFKDARDNWRKTVVPYANSAVIRKASEGGELPSDILKFLEKQSADKKYDVIRNDLKSNPEHTKSLLAQVLSQEAKSDTKGNISLSAEKVLKTYNNLPNLLKDLLGKDLKNEMSKIEKSRNTAEKAEKYTIVPKIYKKITTGKIL